MARDPFVLGILLVSVSLWGAHAVYGAEEQKKVLVLYSTRRDTQLPTIGDRDFPGLLESGVGEKVDYYSEHIDAVRFPEAQYQQSFRDYLALKYHGFTFDVVIADHNLAADFVSRYRDRLFPGAPVVFVTDGPTLQRLPNSAGILAAPDYRRTLSMATQLQPDTTHVFVVAGSSVRDKANEDVLRSQLEPFEKHLTITYLSGLRIDELEQRLKTLPEHSIVYYLLFYQDVGGTNVNPLQFLERLAAIANRPTYSWVNSALDHGVVGGSLVSQESEIEAAADLAIRVLHGESPDTIPLSTANLHVNQVDWRQLQRWNLSEARLPSGTIVRFRESSIWERYGTYILGSIALVLAQALLIVGLLVQRGRRRRAEEKVRASEAELRASYDRIRDLGGRLLTAQDAERSRIARELHDDVSQQIALLSVDLQMLTAFGSEQDAEGEKLAREALDRVQGIARSVHDLSHQLHPAKLRLMSLVTALGSLQHEFARSDLSVTFSHQSVPPMTPRELTFVLFRVAQEVLRNAYQHSGGRHISIQLRGTPDGLTLTIADDGLGFDVDSRWGTGLGLVSINERLEQVGGTLRIHSTMGRGTRVEIAVPTGAGVSQQVETVAV